MQLASIEFARNVLGLEGANSSEINPDTPYAIIALLPEQKDVEDLGGYTSSWSIPHVKLA